MSNRVGFNSTGSFSQEILEGADWCEHCPEGDTTNAVGYTWERDSFGLVAACICCSVCKDEFYEHEAAELVGCHDCNQEFRRSETTSWVPYDHYPQQGDVPMILCNPCRLADKHVQRCKLDDEDYNFEHGCADDEEDHDVDNDD